MKKIISILLVVVLVFACASITVYAEYEYKLESNLLSVLETIEDDFKLQVFIWINDTVDEELVIQKTFEQCGLTQGTAKTKEEVDLYQRTYRNIKAQLYEEYNNIVFEKMNVADADVIFFSQLTPSFIIKATKSKVYELAELDEVVSIGLHKMPLFPQPEHLYEKRFLELYEDMIFSETHDYDELYYHHDENGEVDWALIEQCSHNAPPWEYHRVFKGRVFMYGDHRPFSFRYGIYDVKEDKFYDIIDDQFDYSKYDDLEEVFNTFNFGYLIGDSDSDGVLSVMDATLIQMSLAGLTDLDDVLIDYDGYFNGFPKYISDFDCDGMRTIMDATGIQMKLAEIY